MAGKSGEEGTKESLRAEPEGEVLMTASIQKDMTAGVLRDRSRALQGRESCSSH